MHKLKDLKYAQEKIIFVRQEHEYDDVYSFYFEKGKVSYKAGQYARILVNDTKRKMSFASAPSEDLLRFTMHTDTDSSFKLQMLNLKPGDTITLFKIKGHFSLPDDEKRNIVFIAGGVGMTPIRSLLVDAAMRQRKLRTTLVQVQRGEHLYADELQDKVSEYLKISPEDFTETIASVANKYPDALFYMAGSERLVEGALSVLRACGIDKDSIIAENFND